MFLALAVALCHALSLSVYSKLTYSGVGRRVAGCLYLCFLYMNVFEKIRSEGRLLFEYVRGSHLYGLNNADSDVDTGGVFLCGTRELLTAVPVPLTRDGSSYQAQVSDERHDNNWFEIGEYIRLAIKSNPNVLESLFVPERLIIGQVHPIMSRVIAARDGFISKDFLKATYSYVKEQVYKARGLNKKITNPVKERLSPYDFMYTFLGQGSTRFKHWLENHGLYSRYCGLVNVPNMHEVFGVYYDFGQHRVDHPECTEDQRLIRLVADQFRWNPSQAREYLLTVEPAGYKGVVAEDGSSNEPRLSAVWDREARPICHIQYNMSGYTAHCRAYQQYQKWVLNRNEKRYLSNLDKNYDSKNMMHCFRLLHMAKEIATGQGVRLERTDDRDFLMEIRNHHHEYDELIERVEREKEVMPALIEQAPLPDHVDTAWATELLLDIRKEQLRLFPI